MEIVFCARCGVRLNEDQFASGEAVKLAEGEGFYCRACVPSSSRSSGQAGDSKVPVASASKRKPSARVAPVRAKRRPSSRRAT